MGRACHRWRVKPCVFCFGRELCHGGDIRQGCERVLRDPVALLSMHPACGLRLDDRLWFRVQ